MTATRRPEEPDDLIVQCSCMRMDHMVCFCCWPDGDALVGLALSLERPWYRRLATAWRYLLGTTCAFGGGAECILKESDIPKLRGWLDRFEVGVADARRAAMVAMHAEVKAESDAARAAKT